MVATKFFARAAVLLVAAAGQASAYGSAIIHNQCKFKVYLWSISDTDSSMQTLSAEGGEYTEAYQTNPDGGGISIKMGIDTTRSNVTQFEYTLVDDALWYDLSNINGYPFWKYGVTVVPSDTSCRSVTCPAGTDLCAAAYNTPTDNYATAECGASANSVIVLCSGETDADGSSSVSSVASAAASTASTVTEFSSTTSVEAKTTESKSTTTEVESATTTVSTKHYTHHTQQKEAATTTAVAASTKNSNPYVVVHTTFVTHVVTVEGRSAEATAAAKPKRDVHHEHEAVHREHAQRRHTHPRAFAQAA